MNDEVLYCIFDSNSGFLVGYRLYRSYDVAEAFRVAYYPNNTYVSRVIVKQDRS